MQGMLGETYDRLLAGDAIMDPENPLHLPDDRQWHGIGNESHYKMDSYFDTNHTFNLCATAASSAAVCPDACTAHMCTLGPCLASI